jgi:hypothetical protein
MMLRSEQWLPWAWGELWSALCLLDDFILVYRSRTVMVGRFLRSLRNDYFIEIISHIIISNSIAHERPHQ